MRIFIIVNKQKITNNRNKNKSKKGGKNEFHEPYCEKSAQNDLKWSFDYY